MRLLPMVLNEEPDVLRIVDMGGRSDIDRVMGSCCCCCDRLLLSLLTEDMTEVRRKELPTMLKGGGGKPPLKLPLG